MARSPGAARQPGSKRTETGAPDPAWATDDDIARIRSRLKRKEAVWWFDLVKVETRSAGLLTTVDLSIFQEWAETKAAWEIQNALVTAWEDEITAAAMNGEKEAAEQASVYPRCYSLRNQYSKRMRDLEAQIGYSPSARTRIKAAQSQGDWVNGIMAGIQYTAEIPRRSA